MEVVVMFGTKYRNAVVIVATHNASNNAIARELNCIGLIIVNYCRTCILRL